VLDLEFDDAAFDGFDFFFQHAALPGL